MWCEVDCFISREERELRFSGFFPLETSIAQPFVLRSCIVIVPDCGDGKMALLYIQSKILVCETHSMGRDIQA